MSNYNFFDPYIVPPRRINYKRVLAFLFFVTLAVTLVLAYVVMQQEVTKLEDEKSKLNHYINSEKVNQQLKEVERLDTTIASYNETLLLLNVVSTIDQNLAIFDNSILEMIDRTMPNEVFIDTLKVNQNGINILGSGNSIESIALFNHRLLIEDTINNTKIVRIENRDGVYSYEIIAVQRGGALDEAQKN